jgi:hypothetical protein
MFRFEACPFGDARQHRWPELLVVVKSKDDILPAVPGECAMGTGLSFDGPAEP